MAWYRRITFGFLLLILLLAAVYMISLLLPRLRAIQVNSRPIPPAAIVEVTAVPTFEHAATQAQATAVASQPVTEIQLVPVTNGLTWPVALAHAYDDRLFIAEQAGRIRILDNGTLLPESFLDIQHKVRNDPERLWDEQGLLGLAFHPRFQENGLFFVNYTSENDGSTILAHYRVDATNPNRADPLSETVILSIGQPYDDHNAGHLQFDQDGFLYMAAGDGGDWGDPHGNSQNPGTLLGSILRLYVDANDTYTVPSTNPFVGDTSKRGEVWVYGLRNPWRFSFDRLTGDLYIADVGQALWEELNFLPGGGQGGENLGWNIVEGPACYDTENCDKSGFVEPIVTYEHNPGCAIVSGYIYRGLQFPSLAGNYFFADYCQGTIWSLMNSNGEWVQNEVYQDDIWLSSFGEDVNGELYVLAHRDGIVYQIQP